MVTLPQPGMLVSDDEGHYIVLGPNEPPASRARVLMHLAEHQHGVLQGEAISQWHAARKVRRADRDGQLVVVLEDAERDALKALVARAYAPEAFAVHQVFTLALHPLTQWLEGKVPAEPEAAAPEPEQPASE